MDGNMENKPKGFQRTKTLKVLEVIILVLLICLLGSVVYDQYIAKDNKDNSTSTTTETAKLSDTDKKSMLSVLGLTETGYPKQIHLDVPANADINPYNFQIIMLGLNKTGDIKLDNLSNEDLIKLIYNYAQNNNMIAQISGEEYATCEAGAGYCEVISFDNYKDIAKIYGITKDGKDLFGEEYVYKTNYRFTFEGSVSEPVTITDKFTFEEGTELVKVIYDIKVENTNNAVTDNKTITYSFKKENGSYNLNGINIKDNLEVNNGDVVTE